LWTGLSFGLVLIGSFLIVVWYRRSRDIEGLENHEPVATLS